MKLVKFLFWSSIGTAAWSSILAVAGFILGTQFERVDEIVGPISSAIIAGIIIFYIWRQFTWSKRHS